MKLSFFLTSLLLFSFSYSLAQTDSLSTKSFEELESLYIASIYTSPEKAKHYADALYLVTLQGTNKQRIAKALYRKGYINFKLGNTIEAHEFTEASLKIAHQIKDDDLLLQNYTQKGSLHSKAGAYKKAIEYYIKAKKIVKKTENLRDLLAMTYNIGLVKKQIEDYPEALEDFKNNLKEIKKWAPKYTLKEALNCTALADVYLRMENPDSALVYINRGLSKVPKDAYKELYIDLALNKVIVLFQQQHHQQSIDVIHSLKKTIEEIGNKQKFVTSYLYLGKNYNTLKNSDSAIVYFEKIKTLVNINNFSFSELEEVYYHLARLYSQKQNTEKANENFKLFEDFSKENNLANKKTYHTIKDYDISTLQKEISTLNTQSQQQEKTVYYLYIIASIFLTCIIGFLIFYKQKQRNTKKRFDTLLERIQKIETPKKPLVANKQKSELAINDEGVVQILKDLEKFEQKQYFLNVDCNLSYTAKKLKTNTTYLSHVINTYKGKSFTVYLTELRIDAALIGLKNDKKIRMYSMEAIANEFGFKRRETFSKIFKSMTGMHPTNYIKELQKEREESRDN